MSRIPYNSKDIELLARIMRAEAVGEGVFGMKLVGNVVVNRVVATCKPFKNKKTINEVVFQKNAFEGTTSSLFNGRPNEQLKKIAKDCITFWRAEPAYKALYFYAPGKNNKCKSYFWGDYTGKYKNHCFYEAENNGDCNL
ncbi:MAG: cell wall hydrolase [Bacilli bacterium]